MKTLVQPKSSWKLELGANFIASGNVKFNVWAPIVNSMSVKIYDGDEANLHEMHRDEKGYFSATVAGVCEGLRYCYVLDGKKERPDPASRFQPDGIHKPSMIVNSEDFVWTDEEWKGVSFQDLIFYELHIGTFTPEGTFEAAIQKIPYLKELGVTCIEIMPVGEFPGERNWGYDGVHLYAPQHSYGTPNDLKKFINACHFEGLSVCLDVVYNHLGPEGNYLREFGPYFTKKYHTPWGEAVNYDGAESQHVRRFVIDNALYWIHEFHIDVLRLDAVHGIYDFSAKHILKELNSYVHVYSSMLGRDLFVIAESDLNDSRVIRPKMQGGYALSGQWSDDFHHAVHAFLTGERHGYYSDFGSFEAMTKALSSGFVYDGVYSKYRKRNHGNHVGDLPRERLVTFVQNHDQIGNRPQGERIGNLISFQQTKLAASLLLLSPNTPLIFMGEEYGETAPFQYFIDHLDESLVQAVREGRRKEFELQSDIPIPDPKSETTFLKSKLNWSLIQSDRHLAFFKLYQDLIAIRKSLKSITGRKYQIYFSNSEKWIAIDYRVKKAFHMGILFSFSDKAQMIKLPFPGKSYRPQFSTEDVKYLGSEHKIVLEDGWTQLPSFCAVAGNYSFI